MTAAYLWFNAAMYLIFALLCTLKSGKTTVAQGFLTLDNNGRCEYFAIYGGMEMGFAAFYAICAMKPEFRSAGLLFSQCMYAGIVVWRMTALVSLNGISPMTKGIAALEVVLFAGAAYLNYAAKTAQT